MNENNVRNESIGVDGIVVKWHQIHNGYGDNDDALLGLLPQFILERKTVVTCKIKHLQKRFRAADFPRRWRWRKNVVKCFILHVTTSYVQHVFNMLKHLQKMF